MYLAIKLQQSQNLRKEEEEEKEYVSNNLI
jgi:hypothetical protein